jgi:hypothetical protein
MGWTSKLRCIGCDNRFACSHDFQANRESGVKKRIIPDTIANALFGRYDLAPQLRAVSYNTHPSWRNQWISFSESTDWNDFSYLQVVHPRPIRRDWTFSEVRDQFTATYTMRDDEKYVQKYYSVIDHLHFVLFGLIIRTNLGHFQKLVRRWDRDGVQGWPLPPGTGCPWSVQSCGESLRRSWPLQEAPGWKQ